MVISFFLVPTVCTLHSSINHVAKVLEWWIRMCFIYFVKQHERYHIANTEVV